MVGWPRDVGQQRDRLAEDGGPTQGRPFPVRGLRHPRPDPLGGKEDRHCVAPPRQPLLNLARSTRSLHPAKRLLGFGERRDGHHTQPSAHAVMLHP